VAALSRPGRSPVDLDRVAVLGHSMGGILTVNYAAIADAASLPVPKAIMPVEPGGCADCQPGPARFGVPLADLTRIRPDTLALMVVGAGDEDVRDDSARPIWDRLRAIPLDQRDYVIVQNDDRGSPALRADHYFPLSGTILGEVDALDWYGTWKLFDALTACAFDGRGCDRVLGGTDFQRYMGEWSDGTPVAPLIVTDHPPSLWDKTTR
jgi:pimeloyl-ACP methyl ester carboxylesterase